MSTNPADAIFKGTKARWLPLFHRLLARVNRIAGLELKPLKTSIVLHNTGTPRHPVATIRPTPKGLQLGFALSKAALKTPRLKTLPRKRAGISHQTIIGDVSQIDEEVILWLRAAQHQVRTAKRRST